MGLAPEGQLDLSVGITANLCLGGLIGRHVGPSRLDIGEATNRPLREVRNPAMSAESMTTPPKDRRIDMNRRERRLQFVDFTPHNLCSHHNSLNFFGGIGLESKLNLAQPQARSR